MVPLDNFDEIIKDFKSSYQNGKISYLEKKRKLLIDWKKISKQKEELNQWLKKFEEIEYQENNVKVRKLLEELEAEQTRISEYFGDSPELHPEWFEEVENKLNLEGVQIEHEDIDGDGLRYVTNKGEIDSSISGFSDFSEDDIEFLVRNIRQNAIDLETSFGNYSTEELRLILKLLGARARLLQVLIEMDKIKDNQRQLISSSVTMLRTILKSSPMVGFIEPFHSGFKDKVNWLDYVISSEKDLREFQTNKDNQVSQEPVLEPEEKKEIEEALKNNEEKKVKKEEKGLEKLEELKAFINGTYLSEDVEAQLHLREQILELMELLGAQHEELILFAKENNQYLSGSEFRSLRRVMERESGRMVSVGEQEILEYERRLNAENAITLDKPIVNSETVKDALPTTEPDDNSDSQIETSDKESLEIPQVNNETITENE